MTRLFEVLDVTPQAEESNEYLTQHLKRVEYVAANYEDLKGLVYVPYALFFFGWAAFDAGWLVGSPWILLPLGIGLASGLGALISRYYYDRAFGRVYTVADRRGRDRRDWLLMLPFISIYAFAGVVEDPRAEASRLMLIVALFVPEFWRKRAVAVHWITLASFVILLCLLPLIEIAFGSRLFDSDNAWDIIVEIGIGLMFLIGGTLDHRLLVRTLKPLPAEAELEAV